MKARIEKKLCKKIVEILPDLYRHAWTDGEVTERAWEQGSRVSSGMYVGGGVDCWGEGEDEYTVLSDFISHHDWHPPIYTPYPTGHEWEGMPMRRHRRLTGKYLIGCAIKIAKHQR